MATESPLRFVGNSGAGSWLLCKDTPGIASTSTLSEELGLLLKGQKYNGTKSNTGLSRSGSAPPSMEGSCVTFDILQTLTDRFDVNLDSLQNCKSEEELRAHPGYLAYYCKNVNLNPRLPSPLISRENRHLMQQIGSIGNNEKLISFNDNSNSIFSVSQHALSTHNEEPEDDRSPRMSPLQRRHMNPIDLVEEDLFETQCPVYNNHSQHPNHSKTERAVSQDSLSHPLHNSSTDLANPEKIIPRIGTDGCTHLDLQSGGLLLNDDLGTMPGHLASIEKSVNLQSSQYESSNRSTTLGDGVSTTGGICSDPGDIENEVRKLKLSAHNLKNHQICQNPQQAGMPSRGSSSHSLGNESQIIAEGISHSQGMGFSSSHGHPGQPKLTSADMQSSLQSASFAPSLYITGSGFGTPYYHNFQFPGLPPQFSINGYTLNPSVVPQLINVYPHPHSSIPVPFDNPVGSNFTARASESPSGGGIVSGVDMHYKNYEQLTVQPPFPDPLYVPFCQHPSVDAFQTPGQYDPMICTVGAIGIIPGNCDAQKISGYPPHLIDHRPQIPRISASTPDSTKGIPFSPSYYGSPASIDVMQLPSSPLASHVFIGSQLPSSPLASPVFIGSPVAGAGFSGRKNENVKFPFGSEKNTTASGWKSQRGCEKIDDPLHSFLEELKSNKARRYELSDISGRIVEFSSDQHGSRFIQQKLENCSIQDKASVFKEILPHASSLMTDVFGNYVIQKFFEHGTPDQRNELAYKLVCNVLPLSLQMYGCRVIQKALEVIELDLKTQLVQELDGHVMKCVRDQNGNHVIQKCIECVPTEKITFIISAFHGQVATLSTHPYGCRVIQRVLEHCTDESQSRCIVDEILQSVCQLAQDQYGNYVTQHVLEKGKPHERSQIISKLSGKILQMCQHKFASNVVEKCIKYGNAEERDHLIKEIIGETEDSDNLLVMMKDQFGNYVIQKILDSCTDKQREILVNRIKVHLQSLKKYTYGKHIVARVEQLCADAPESPES
ncbi:pumilio homolog 5-like isoform X1 [Zingiber officinale]|uniref:pumilio homolog 5-like isoform X1 n=2 Tax=Zingiber officinale TaxID=94328 RepID=UPI001C4BB2B0|nr:pumilio homolog 5-like isoform X1 [Zingiber officinale]XP_042430892.1 pumilio homolog 5-like isoform X1 [Zingiber officinale]